MFCRFCGKEIPEGGVCDCQQSANAAVQSETVQPASVSETGGVNVNVSADDIKALFLTAVVKPCSIIEYALSNTRKIPQYIIGAIYAVLVFLLPVIELNVLFGEYSKSMPIGKAAFFILLTVVITRAIVALIPFGVSFGQKSFKDIFAAVCASTALPCILRLILTITLLIKWGPLIVFASIVNSCTALVLDYEIIKTTSGKKDAALWLFVLAELIAAIVIYILCKGVIADISKNLYRF